MKTITSGLTPLSTVGLHEVVLTPLDERVLGCSFGHYPWDDWEHAATKAGVPEKLAALGRAVMREAYQHQWDDRLKSLCGWSDEGQALLAFALRAPKTAQRRWDILMRTDGLRGDYRLHGTEWTYGFLRTDARRLAGRLSKQATVQHLSAFSLNSPLTDGSSHS